MPDLNIIVDHYRDRAAVNAESDRALDWLAEHVMIDRAGMTFSTTVEGAQEIEQLARQDGLSVETR